MKTISFKILKSRKGISPILATLLLIVIAVAAISVTYAWIMTNMGSTTNEAGTQIYIGNVSYSGGNTIKVDVGNCGTAVTSIVAVYAGTTSSSMTQMTVTYPATPGSSNSSSIPINGFTATQFTYAYTSGTTYYFKVVPTAGRQALTFQQTAP
jgi:archaeal type IV pilus assembly protein PilA